MIDWVYYLFQTVTLAIAAWFFWETFRNREVNKLHLGGLGVIEVLLLAQLVMSFFLVIPADGTDKGLFFSYLVTAMLILPIAGFWGAIDRSRWGIGTVAIGCLVAAALMLRVNQIWEMNVNVG